MRRTPRVLAATVVSGVVGTTTLWLAPAAFAATGPIVVDDPSKVPAGAIEDVVSTYETENTCDATRSWVLTTPGQHHAAVTHLETRWMQETAAVPAEHRYQRTVEGQEHAAVTGHTYQRVVKGHAATQSSKYKLEGVTYYTVEHKQVRSKDGWTQAEINWLKTHAEKVGDGADATSVWTLNDKTVNDAGVNPFDYPQGVWSRLGGLNAYGGPSGNGDVEYFITAVELYFDKPVGDLFYEVQTKTLYYTGIGSGYSTKASDAVWVSGDAPAGGWTLFDTKSNDDAVADKTYYYDGTADGSTDPKDAVAQATPPGGAWEQFGDPVVIEESTTDPDVTWYYTGDELGSTTEEDAVYTSSNPGGQWEQYGDAKEGTGTEASTVYYNPENPADTTLDEDNWTTFPADAGPDGWTFVDEREVVDVAGYDDPVVLTSYVYSDGVLCAPVTQQETPDEPGTDSDEPTEATKSQDVAIQELAHTGATMSLAVLGAALLAGGTVTATIARRSKAKV